MLSTIPVICQPGHLQSGVHLILESGESRAREAEGRAAEAEGRARELELQWAVERREIQLTEEELGRGGWATVYVAVFRGTRVAAKCIHNQIISQYTVQLFRREMDMASRIRHSNMLQFIGPPVSGDSWKEKSNSPHKQHHP